MASLKRVTHKNGRIVYRIVISLGMMSRDIDAPSISPVP